jgi:hypothetical protein
LELGAKTLAISLGLEFCPGYLFAEMRQDKKLKRRKENFLGNFSALPPSPFLKVDSEEEIKNPSLKFQERALFHS